MFYGLLTRNEATKPPSRTLDRLQESKLGLDEWQGSAVTPGPQSESVQDLRPSDSPEGPRPSSSSGGPLLLSVTNLLSL